MAYRFLIEAPGGEDFATAAQQAGVRDYTPTPHRRRHHVSVNGGPADVQAVANGRTVGLASATESQHVDPPASSAIPMSPRQRARAPKSSEPAGACVLDDTTSAGGGGVARDLSRALSAASTQQVLLQCQPLAAGERETAGQAAGGTCPSCGAAGAARCPDWLPPPFPRIASVVNMPGLSPTHVVPQVPVPATVLAAAAAGGGNTDAQAGPADGVRGSGDMGDSDGGVWQAAEKKRKRKAKKRAAAAAASGTDAAQLTHEASERAGATDVSCQAYDARPCGVLQPNSSTVSVERNERAVSFDHHHRDGADAAVVPAVSAAVAAAPRRPADSVRASNACTAPAQEASRPRVLQPPTPFCLPASAMSQRRQVDGRSDPARRDADRVSAQSPVGARLDRLPTGQPAVEAGGTAGGVDDSTRPSFNLWQQLKAEMHTGSYECVDGEQQGVQHRKQQRVIAFVQVPWYFERLMLLGSLVCIDSLLFMFTFLPLRALLALLTLLARPLAALGKGIVRRRPFQSQQLCDLARLFVCLITLYLLEGVEYSQVYHMIRGQALMKLYVIMKVLEVLDKLCCSFGLDVIDSLFYTLAEGPGLSRPFSFASAGRSLFMLAGASAYVFGHAYLQVLQVATFNVAVNSHNNVLLTILITVQFVELKSSVFQKFEKPNLFQLACSDTVERSHLAVHLLFICIQNAAEASWDIHEPMIVGLPAAVAMIWGSEMVVDWVKHAFITKFNHIHPSVYGQFCSIIDQDILAAITAESSFLDHSHTVSCRLGFISLPIACLAVRVARDALRPLSWGAWLGAASAVWSVLWLAKVGISWYLGRRAANAWVPRPQQQPAAATTTFPAAHAQ